MAFKYIVWTSCISLCRVSNNFWGEFVKNRAKELEELLLLVEESAENPCCCWGTTPEKLDQDDDGKSTGFRENLLAASDETSNCEFIFADGVVTVLGSCWRRWRNEDEYEAMDSIFSILFVRRYYRKNFVRSEGGTTQLRFSGHSKGRYMSVWGFLRRNPRKSSHFTKISLLPEIEDELSDVGNTKISRSFWCSILFCSWWVFLLFRFYFFIFFSCSLRRECFRKLSRFVIGRMDNNQIESILHT